MSFGVTAFNIYTPKITAPKYLWEYFLKFEGLTFLFTVVFKNKRMLLVLLCPVFFTMATKTNPKDNLKWKASLLSGGTMGLGMAASGDENEKNESDPQLDPIAQWMEVEESNEDFIYVRELTKSDDVKSIPFCEFKSTQI